MIKVGITGGIGSGKSTVCKKFEELGVPVFNSDSYAKAHYEDGKVKDKLVDLFGIKVLHNNEVDKTELSKIVFADVTKLDKLMAILQPYVLGEFFLFCQRYKKHAYCIFESAIIYERNLADMFDKIIIVTADKSTRLARVMLRNQAQSEDILMVMNSQLSDEELKGKKHDFIIYNNEHENIASQVAQIHNELKQ